MLPSKSTLPPAAMTSRHVEGSFVSAFDREAPLALRVHLSQFGIDLPLPPHPHLRFMEFIRHGIPNNWLVLVPETYCQQHFEHLEPAIQPAPVSPPPRSLKNEETDNLYQPAPRKKPATSENAPSPHDLHLIRTRASRLVLKCSPTRSTHWGFNPRRIGCDPQLYTGKNDRSLFYTSLTAAHLDLPRIPEPRRAIIDTLLFSAFAYYLSVPSVIARTPRIPLLQNQRDGLRFTLWHDRLNLGSPAQVQVVIHPDDAPPQLIYNQAIPKPYAADRKPELLLLASDDQEHRFYLPTPSQWAQWEQTHAAQPSLAAAINAFLTQNGPNAEQIKISEMYESAAIAAALQLRDMILSGN